jgi:hypothetical protein
MHESYHTDSSASRADETLRSTVGITLRAYEFVGTPPITLILYAIARCCRAGGCITPGVRVLADLAGVSPGIVSPCLYTLADDGWIAYDGRVIMLLIDPAQPSDHDGDRSFDRSEPIDLGRDRFEGDMVLTTANESESTNLVVVESQIPCGAENDQRVDHPPPAAQIMAELGANPRIIREAYESRPDWTPEQVRQRWAYDQRRIAAGGGKLTEGVFFTALRSGELAPVRPDPTQPLDPQSYAADGAYQLSSSATDPPEVESIRDHASRLLPPPTAATHRQYIADWLFLQGRLGAGDSDEDAVRALADYRKAVRR